ncbi:hypothetical protein B0H63DRAFT_460502 [Podospora didyma]|uniref:G domain-containing protein n=1 Tax=Podospora didyma TaxID=330526 RepID=A0AAE0P6L2_9PEZI|nr:hypothetical protein B0H63DRAFT_460502 [Podospora didyma]
MATRLIRAATAAANAADRKSGALAAGSIVSKAASASKSSFQPRQTFEVSDSITRSYFLGHHHAALGRMRQTLNHIGLIIECRDFRVPLSSWNPLLERSLAASPSERVRIIVYTKRDLGPHSRAETSNSRRKLGIAPSGAPRQSGPEVVEILTQFHKEKQHAAAVTFLGTDRWDTHAAGDKLLLEAIKKVAREKDSLTGLRAMVVGMPNAGKSSLLNRMRMAGMNLPKAAKTGAEPGVTRKLGTPVRIVPGESPEDPETHGFGEGVFVMDTPGVFVPYVSCAEDMLKLSLVGCVKDGVVGGVTVADYLLYHLNLVDPTLYRRFCPEPTNDVYEFLRGVARRTGKLRRGGEFSLENAADWVVQEWRRGALGHFLLDTVTPETLGLAVEAAKEPAVSLSQARKKEKVDRKIKNEAKRASQADPGQA